MTVLSPPRPPLIDTALRDARRWCHGQVIDGRPALHHAVRVALAVGRHVADPGQELIAAVVLHDAPDLAPRTLDLDSWLHRNYGPVVLRVVRTLEAEHRALDTADPIIAVDDLPVLLASTADKIVALGSLTRRAHDSGDPRAFFAARPTLLALFPHFLAFASAASGRVPASMSDHLDQVLTTLIDTARPN